MADGSTPNYALVLIEVGASRDTWGNKANANFTSIDTALKTIADAAAGKVSTADYNATDIIAKLVAVGTTLGGIDADKLDGHHATDFVFAAALTDAAILASVKVVDGAGSGLDADLLDGQHAAAFAPVAHTHAYLPSAGGPVTGEITNGGALLHHTVAGMGSGRVFLSPAAGADPRSLPGDVWLGY